MATYFLRYTATPELDMENEYSVHMTPFVVGQVFFGDEEESEEARVAESIDCSEDDIIIVNGQYAQRLEGLCAFELSADTLEEAIKEAKEHEFNGVYNFESMGDLAVIFEGEYAGDCPEGELMTALKIAHKF